MISTAISVNPRSSRSERCEKGALGKQVLSMTVRRELISFKDLLIFDTNTIKGRCCSQYPLLQVRGLYKLLQEGFAVCVHRTCSKEVVFAVFALGCPSPLKGCASWIWW